MTPMDAFAQGYAIVVPNQRLAQYWGLEIIKKHGAQKGSPIASYRSFVLHHSSLQSWASEVRFLEEASAIVWIAATLLRSESLGSSQSLSFAQTLYQAHTRLTRWQMRSNQGLLYFPNPAQTQFIQTEKNLSQQKDLFQMAFLEDLAQKLVHSAPESLGEKPLYWYGFDDPSPLQRALFQACKSRNPEGQLESDVKVSKLKAQGYLFESEKEEFAAALQWLQQCPSQERCAIVVSDLQSDYQSLQRQALELCDPDLSRLPLPQISSHYSFSLGTALSETFPVSALFEALRKGLPISQGPSDPDRVLYGKEDDRNARLSYWRDRLLQFLIDSQWLESFTLSSQEYQAAQAFWEVLLSLADLSGALAPLGQSDFLSLLYATCSLSIFQPQSLHKTHMILGLLEASALPWDRIWLVRSDRSRFPQSLQKHPLLPEAMQEIYDFPHSTLDRETRYLKKILSRLLAYTSSRTVSWSQRLENGEIAELSPIIEDLIATEYSMLRKKIVPIPERTLFHSPPSPKTAGTLSLSQIESLRSCLFQGWAKTLPQSMSPWRDPPLFDPRSYGIFWHESVQTLLTRGKASAALPPQWTPQIRSYAYAKIQGHTNFLQKTFPQTSWICEHSVIFTLDRFFIRGRIDLFDPVSQRVVDIKTRKTSLASWTRPDPLNWQGPLYALATGARTLGLLSFFEDRVLYQESDISPYRSAWKDHLKALLKKWAHGDYKAEPLEEIACRLCAFKTACRYHMVSPTTHERRL